MATPKKVSKRGPGRPKGVRSRSTSARAQSGVMETQKVINRDYKELFRDYSLLAEKIWERPATKFIVGSFAAAALIPLVMRIFKNPKVDAFIHENIDNVEGRLSDVGRRINEKVADMSEAVKGPRHH